MTDQSAKKPLTVEQRLEALEKKVVEQKEEMNRLRNSNRILNENMHFLRELVEENVHLTEQTSAIVVEHCSTLDSRLNEIGTVFAEKIKNSVAKMKDIEEDIKIETRKFETANSEEQKS